MSCDTNHCKRRIINNLQNFYRRQKVGWESWLFFNSEDWLHPPLFTIRVSPFLCWRRSAQRPCRTFLIRHCCFLFDHCVYSRSSPSCTGSFFNIIVCPTASPRSGTPCNPGFPPRGAPGFAAPHPCSKCPFCPHPPGLSPPGYQKILPKTHW